MFDVVSPHKKRIEAPGHNNLSKAELFLQSAVFSSIFCLNLSLYRRVEKLREKSSSVLGRWKRARGYYNAVES